MATVTIYVDYENLCRMNRGKEFTGWNMRSMAEPIQINVPASAIAIVEEYEEGYMIDCFKKEDW